MTPVTTNEGDSDHEAGENGDAWEAVGRAILAAELRTAGDQIHEACYDVSDRVRGGDDLTADDVRDLRIALNETRRHVEGHLAAVADGTEPWGPPRPPVPSGVLWQWTNHPNADGVDPWEYIDPEDQR